MDILLMSGLTRVMFLPARQIVEIIMDPPEAVTVVLLPLGCQPLGGEFPGENISLVEIFIPGVLSPSHGCQGVLNCHLPIFKLSLLSLTEAVAQEYKR